MLLLNGVVNWKIRTTFALFTLALPLSASSCEGSGRAAPLAFEAQTRGGGPGPSAARTSATATPTTANVDADAPVKETLRLASWNLQWLSTADLHGPVKRRPVDYARLARYAQLLDADVVAVQEVESEQALARVFDTQHYAFHLTADRSNQKTGFVYSKDLNVEILPDVTALSAGGLRSGADIALRFGQLAFRLLSVHLKSGCFDLPLVRDNCKALRAQVPTLEAWIDQRALELVPFAVLGDFNRRFFGRPNEEVWSAIDDAMPPESDLDSPTRGQRSTCWSAEHPQFIDHLVLSRTLAARVVPNSFKQQTYAPSDEVYRRQLSDHCPIAVTLSLSSAQTPGQVATLSGASPLIKANISRSGKRLYHTVDCPNYDRVKIDISKGERYFSSEHEAQAAGFDLAPGCRK